MKKIFLFSLLLTSSFNVIAQNRAKIDNLLSTIQSSKKKDTLSLVYRSLAEQFVWSYPDSALQYADKGVEIAKKQNAVRDAFECNLLRSLALALIGIDTLAITNALEGIEVSKSLKLSDQFSAKRTYGQVLYWLKRYDNALEVYKQSLDFIENEIHFDHSKTYPDSIYEFYRTANLNIGQTLYKLNPQAQSDSVKAGFYIAQAASFDNLIKKNDWYVILLFKARLAYRAKDYQAAKEEFKKCIEVHKKDATSDNANNFTAEYIGLSQSYYEQGEKQEAILNARMAYSEAIKFTNPNYQFDAAKWNAELYEKIGQIDSAFIYLKLTLKLDSIIRNRKNEQKAYALIYEKKNNDDKDVQEKADKRHHILIVMIIIASLLLGFLYFRISANKKNVKFLSLIWLFMVFEYLNMVIHKYIGDFVHHHPILMLLILILMAAALSKLHHYLEIWVIKITTVKKKTNRKNLIGGLKKTLDNQTNSEAKP